MISKSYKKIITKQEYWELVNLQNFHNMLIGLLERIELQALEITQEIDNDIDSNLFLGGITSDMINGLNSSSILDGLKSLNIEIEKDKIVESKKEIGRVVKKKFKSGQWAKNKELDKPVVVRDSPILHAYLQEFSDKSNFENVVMNITPSENNGFDIKNIYLIDNKDGLFVIEH